MENVEHVKLLDLADPKRIKETVNTLIDLHNQVNIDVRDIATTAAITANRAKTTADTANDTATEALAKSNTALQQSEDALQNSADAVQVSETAVQQANTAVNTANQAFTQSATALQVSETADTNSTNALQQAQTAVTTATSALETITDTEQKVEQALKRVENAATKKDIQEAIAEIPVPDVSGQIQTHNEDSDAHPDMRRAIAEFKTIQELDTDRINIYELANGIYTFKDKEEMQYTLYYTPLYQVTPFPITRAGCLLFIGDQIIESYVAGESSPTRHVVNNYALLFNGVGNIYYGYSSSEHGGSTQKFEFDTSNFVTKSVNDLVNYYTKTEVYTQAEVDALLQELSGIDPENLMEKTNPVATGSFSLNRKRLSTTGDYSSTLGYDNTASGMYAHAEGYLTNATADRTHAEGNRTTASGNNSHAEGASTTASGGQSHAEGSNTVASSTNAHAEGNNTKATGTASHAEGSSSEASGDYSHAEGASSKASGDYSHAEGLSTKATHRAQHVFGEYNEQDPSTNSATSRGSYVEIVGNGTSSSPSNARTLDWYGNEILKGSSTASGFKIPGGTSEQCLTANGGTKVIDVPRNVDGATIFAINESQRANGVFVFPDVRGIHTGCTLRMQSNTLTIEQGRASQLSKNLFISNKFYPEKDSYGSPLNYTVVFQSNRTDELIEILLHAHFTNGTVQTRTYVLDDVKKVITTQEGIYSGDYNYLDYFQLEIVILSGQHYDLNIRVWSVEGGYSFDTYGTDELGDQGRIIHQKHLDDALSNYSHIKILDATQAYDNELLVALNTLETGAYYCNGKTWIFLNENDLLTRTNGIKVDAGSTINAMRKQIISENENGEQVVENGGVTGEICAIDRESNYTYKYNFCVGVSGRDNKLRKFIDYAGDELYIKGKYLPRPIITAITGTENELSSYWLPLWRQKTMMGQYCDIQYRLAIGNRYNDGSVGHGVLSFGFRTNDTTQSSVDIQLHVESGRLDPSKFKIYKQDDDMFELWVNVGARWAYCVADIISIHDRTRSLLEDPYGEFVKQAFSEVQTPAGTATDCSHSSIKGNLTVSGYVNATSDIRLKENIVDVDETIVKEMIENTPIKAFNYKENGNRTIGLIAQDIENIGINGAEFTDKDENGFLKVRESKLVYILWNYCQQLNDRIKELEKKVD